MTKDERKIYMRAWRNKNRAHVNKWQQEYKKKNPEKIKECKKRDYDKHIEARRATSRKNHYKNRDKVNERRAMHQKVNRENINKQTRLRYRTDLQFKYKRKIRNAVNGAIKRNSKSGLGLELTGVTSIDFLKGYLQRKFKPGMTWDNRGSEGWHIDHIKPIRVFDLTKKENWFKAYHFTNLQPLWAKENRKKEIRYGI